MLVLFVKNDKKIEKKNRLSWSLQIVSLRACGLMQASGCQFMRMDCLTTFLDTGIARKAST